MSSLRRLAVAAVCLVVTAAWLTLAWSRTPTQRAEPDPAPVAAPDPSVAWPAEGGAAFTRDGRHIVTRPGERAAPIASVAKVMTAYVVLRKHPLKPGQDGPTLTVTRDDAVDTLFRAQRDESVVAVEPGERLTERQALEALLIPSANNIAIMLARFTSGDVDTFVWDMNATARSLGMRHTRYTDPSGYADDTTSTASDQVRLALAAMRDPVFRAVVAMPRTTLPVAGPVANTDTLLGRGGFVGIKTGSHDAAGGCFVFRVVRRTPTGTVVLTGAVLGQRDGPLIKAALAAAADLASTVLSVPS